MSKDKKDIGIVGMWLNSNYGGALTYYGLYEAVKELGYSVLMLAQPLNSRLRPSYVDCRFQKLPYAPDECARIPLNEEECTAYNDMCEVFLAGSDQMFQPNIYKATQKIQSLFWAQCGKGKVGYAFSWGTEVFAGTKALEEEQRFYLKRFDKISVREQSAVKLVSDSFGLQVEQVLDPVFLCDVEKYEKMSDRGCSRIPKEKYVFSYVLTVTYEIGESLKQFAKKKQLNCIRAVTEATGAMGSKKGDWDIDCISDASIEEWLAHIKNAEYVITDSFHGVCFCILFRKPFIVLANYNEYRGRTRLDSILGQLKLSDRIVENSHDILNENLHKSIDWETVWSILDEEKKRCYRWLEAALVESISNSSDELDMYDILAKRNYALSAKVEELADIIRNKERCFMRKDRLQLCGKTMYTSKDIRNFNEMRMTNNFDFLSKWLFVKQKGQSVIDELLRLGYRRIAIYGVGRTGILLLNEIEIVDKIEVVYMMDQSISYYRNEKVYKQVPQEEVDAIIVTPINAFDEIYRTLVESTKHTDIISLERVVSDLYDRICD